MNSGEYKALQQNKRANIALNCSPRIYIRMLRKVKVTKVAWTVDSMKGITAKQESQHCPKLLS